MLQRKQTFSFSAIMKIAPILFFCLFSMKLLAQDTSVAGIIFDTDSKDRLARVNVLNRRTGVSVYDNLNGVFTIQAQPGDQLIFTQQEHYADTVNIKSYEPLAIYLKRNSIQLKEVTILDSLLNPQKQLLSNRRNYSKAYGSLANKDLLAFSPGAGVGIGIDALYNMWSREGRNAEHLRETIQADYRQDVIDYRFNKTLVNRVTGLKDARLADFMLKYRPGYYFVIEASDYEFIAAIRNNLKRYFRNPRAYTLAPLEPAKKDPASLPVETRVKSE